MNAELKIAWLRFFAIAAVFYVVGMVIDFFMKKKEVRKLHDFFLTIANALAKAPLKQWQARISGTGVGFLDKLNESTFIFIGRGIVVVFEPLDKWAKRSGDLALLLFLLAVPTCYVVTHWWMLGAICLPFLFLLLFVIVYTIFEFLNRIEIHKSALGGLIRVLSPTALSALLSLMAAFVSIHVIPESLLNSHWYAVSEGAIRPSSPFLLPLINFPFDLVTILVTISLLRFVHKKEKFFFLAALVDICISAGLAVVLHASLLAISNGWDLLGFAGYCVESVVWFREIGACVLDSWRIGGASPMFNDVPELHLLPMLLTTFVPVGIYMSVFIFLAFARPVMWITGRCFEVVGERDESVFKQFAILLASMVAAVKAIYDFLIAP